MNIIDNVSSVPVIIIYAPTTIHSIQDFRNIFLLFVLYML